MDEMREDAGPPCGRGPTAERDGTDRELAARNQCPRIIQGASGCVPTTKRGHRGSRPGAGWEIKNPAGLIVGESVDPLGWRVVPGPRDCLVMVPTFAAPGTGYEVTSWFPQDDEAHGSFDVP